MHMKSRAMWMTVLALLIVGVAGSWMAKAALQGDVGYIVAVTLQEKYIVPALKAPLEAEQKKLQTEFDSKSKGLTEQGKADLFETYQTRLDAKEQELLEPLWVKVNAALVQVAKDTGLRVIIDDSVILYGGINVTTQLLAKLGIK